MNHSFNVRVYGVLLSPERGVLVSDEFIRGDCFTKFPGGGLEYGEGTRECLIREWQEELSQDITVTEHLYTTDFFQVSAFGDGRQIISIYYRVEAASPFTVVFRDKPFDFEARVDQAQAFRWVPLSVFSPDSVTLPIDKVVAELIASPGASESSTQ